jgi:hypothetical protein
MMAVVCEWAIHNGARRALGSGEGDLFRTTAVLSDQSSCYTSAVFHTLRVAGSNTPNFVKLHICYCTSVNRSCVDIPEREIITVATNAYTGFLSVTV